MQHRTTGRPIFLEASKRVRPWRAMIADAAVEALLDRPFVWPKSLPHVASITFSFERAKGHANSKGMLRPAAPRWPCVARRDDIDKLARAALDALTGVLWDDDSQVFALHLMKQYATERCPAGAHFRVRTTTPDFSTPADPFLNDLVAGAF